MKKERKSNDSRNCLERKDWWRHEGKEWARAAWLTGAKTTFYTYARASLRLRPGNKVRDKVPTVTAA